MLKICTGESNIATSNSPQISCGLIRSLPNGSGPDVGAIMPYRREVFVEQGPLVDRFVRHLIHHRSLKPWLARTKVKSPFWGDTSDAHLLQACNSHYGQGKIFR